jgi:hypothetical protein
MVKLTGSVWVWSCAVVVLGHCSVVALGDRPPKDCLPYLNMPLGDLDGMPLRLDNSTACADLCESTSRCALYTFVSGAVCRRHG